VKITEINKEIESAKPIYPMRLKMAAVWSHLSIHPAVLSSLFTTHRVGFMETSKWQGQFDKNKENQPILFCLDINNALSIYLIQQLCV